MRSFIFCSCECVDVYLEYNNNPVRADNIKTFYISGASIIFIMCDDTRNNWRYRNPTELYADYKRIRDLLEIKEGIHNG